MRCADSQLSTSYFGYGKEICCEDINIIMWPWSTSNICSKNMLSHHPTYTTLTSIINMSLKNSVMPYALKVAALKPLLKKQDVDFEQLQNFPPNPKSNICVQANWEGCCFAIKRPYTEAPSQRFTVLKRLSLEFTMIFSLLLMTIKPLFYFYSTYLLPLIL